MTHLRLTERRHRYNFSGDGVGSINFAASYQGFFFFVTIRTGEALQIQENPCFLAATSLVAETRQGTAKLQWLKHLQHHENMIKTGVV